MAKALSTNKRKEDENLGASFFTAVGVHMYEIEGLEKEMNRLHFAPGDCLGLRLALVASYDDDK